MSLLTNLTITGLLVCLLFGDTLAGNGNILKYKVKSSTYIQLQPNASKTILRVNGDFYVRPSKDIKNAYYTSIRNPEVLIERENSTLNLALCLSMIKPSISLLRPFLSVYDDNGLLKHIKVHKSEVDLSVNLKLLASSLLQVNRTQLTGKKVPTNSTSGSELLNLGNCPVNYNVKNISSTKAFQVQKVYNMSLCSELRKGNNDTNTLCHGNLCSTGSEKGFNWTTNADLQVKIEKNSSIIEYLTLIDHKKYKPWQNSSKEIILDKIINVALESTSKHSLIHPFIDVNSEVVTKMWYRDVDESICKKTGSGKDLRETYKALACHAIAENIYLNIYEKAINCWDILRSPEQQ